MAVMVESPVPPRVAASVPTQLGVKVWVAPAEVMVRLMLASVPVAKDCARVESPLSEVIPVVVATQVPLILKQPEVRFTPPPKVEVAVPVMASALVVAPVKTAFVANRLVLVLLVIVAFVPNSEVKVPAVAFKIDAKKLVLVAWVEVLRRILLKILIPLHELASTKSVDDAPVLPTQTPFTA